MTEKIDESNVLLYAARFYDNPNCYDTVEFYEDLKRVSYIKRLFNKYKETGELKDRLVINHLIVLFNVFGSFANKILFLKLTDYLEILIPFLICIDRCPKEIKNIGIDNKTIYTSSINMDNNIIEMLREKHDRSKRQN